MIAVLIAEWILVGAGCTAVVLSMLAALLSSTVYDRLHLLTIVTTVATPLVGVGSAIGQGWSAADGMVLAIVVIVAVTGPVVGAATARATGAREHLMTEEPPP
ncbi:MAG TPA: monovalent cation/H(+) antiporter subunit G [Mycobacterium sp.]|nr:monovalent cation/H(+) antiporter subunit G [Mycobacterium sp.]